MIKLLALFFLAVLSASVNSAELPDSFFSEKAIDLPVSRRTSFPSKNFPLDSGGSEVRRGDEKSVSAIYQLIFSSKSSDIFSINNERWDGLLEKNRKSIGLRVARIPCVQPFDCFLISPDSGAWIVISRNREVTDLQLSRALEYIYNDKTQRNTLVSELDTFYGDVGLFPYPDTDYERTGIFCSVLTTKQPGSNEQVQIFKRRITPEGRIENKELPEGVHECKLPW